MPIDADHIARMERELAEAKRQLLEEHGRRYEILMRLMTEEERQSVLGRLTDKQERILFGLELPDEPKRRGRKPGTSQVTKGEGNLSCPYCEKAGLTERGLKLHIARMHKGQEVRARELDTGAEVS